MTGISHMQTEAQMISYVDHGRLAMDLGRQDINTYSDDSQEKRVSPFSSASPVA